MPSISADHRLSSRERTFLAGLVICAFTFVAVSMGSRAYRTVQNMERVDEPIRISRAGLLQMADPQKAFDNSKATVWHEPVWNFLNKTLSENRSHIADPSVPYLLFEAGLSHRADEPPAIDPPRKLIMHFPVMPDNARVRTVRISTFQQQLVDIDREYAFPSAPVFMHSEEFQIGRDAEQFTISLEPLVSTPKPSTGFPDRIQKYWFRLDFSEFYNQGSLRPDAKFSVSEIEVVRNEKN